MSYEAMYKIRASGLVDRTQVDVLEALAFFQNSDSGACFPSTDAIARVSRVNDRLVRTTLKKLHDLGYVSSEQQSGQRRYFTLHLDRLPEPVNETAPLYESTPLHETAPLYESTGEGCRKVQGTPVGKCRGPLYKTTAESVIEPVINKEGNKEGSAPAEGDLFNDDVKKIEKPKASRAKAKTSCPFGPDAVIPANYLQYAMSKHPDLNAQTEFTKFVNNHISKDNKFSDWLAAWRYWVGNIKTYSRQTQRSTNIRFEGHDNDFSCIYG